jgi:hypothetical protein
VFRLLERHQCLIRHGAIGIGGGVRGVDDIVEEGNVEFVTVGIQELLGRRLDAHRGDARARHYYFRGARSDECNATLLFAIIDCVVAFISDTNPCLSSIEWYTTKRRKGHS